jgi:hypothetical protein
MYFLHAINSLSTCLLNVLRQIAAVWEINKKHDTWLMNLLAIRCIILTVKNPTRRNSVSIFYYSLF